MAEFRALTERLFDWMAPADMKLHCDTLNIAIGDNPFTNKARAFREAFVASRFAECIGASQVKLLKESSAPIPDLAINLNGDILNYEITELDDPKRRRGLEYKTGNFSETAMIENVIFLEQLTHLSKMKSIKPYVDVSGLLIWTNIFSEIPICAFEAQQASLSAGKAFSEVWLWQGETFTQLWKLGLPSGDIHRRVA